LAVLPPAGETKFVDTLDGRKLAYVEFGDPTSPLVIHNHGGPSSRLEGRLLANGATSNGLRLVSVDRPGIGRSTPQKDRSYESWANDLLTIADALGYREFGVSGWSEGGPWPLAAAAYLDPARLRHVTSIAGGNYGSFGNMWATHFRKSYIKTIVKMVNCHHGLRQRRRRSVPRLARATNDGPLEHSRRTNACAHEATVIRGRMRAGPYRSSPHLRSNLWVADGLRRNPSISGIGVNCQSRKIAPARTR